MMNEKNIKKEMAAMAKKIGSLAFQLACYSAEIEKWNKERKYISVEINAMVCQEAGKMLENASKHLKEK